MKRSSDGRRKARTLDEDELSGDDEEECRDGEGLCML